MELSIIIPLYNCEKIIKPLYNEIINSFKEKDIKIIYINNGSNDETLKILKNIHETDKNRVKIINFLKEYDFNYIIKTGILHSKSKYTEVFNVNSNVSFSYIYKLYENITKNTEYDYVCVNNVVTKVNKFKKILFNSVNNLFNTKVNITFTNCIILRNNILNTIIESNANIEEILTSNYNGYIYKIKTDKHQNIIDIFKNNIDKCIKYLSVSNLLISTLIFTIYILLVFLKVLKFNYMSIFLFFIMIFLSINSLCISIYINKYKKQNVIKEIIDIENDYL